MVRLILRISLIPPSELTVVERLYIVMNKGICLGVRVFGFES